MKRCKHCKEVIQQDAVVCKHCNRHQSNLKYWFNSSANTLTLALLIVTIFQYNDSRLERIEAGKALNTATKSLKRADSINRRLDSTVKLIKRTATLSTQNSYLQVMNPLMRMNIEAKSVKQYEKNLDELMQLLIPDSVARRNWWVESGRLVE